METRIDLDATEKETTQESVMVFSSALAKTGAVVNGMLGGREENRMKTSLGTMTEDAEGVEEGILHQIDVNTEPPQAMPRRAIYEYLLYHHHHQQHHYPND